MQARFIYLAVKLFALDLGPYGYVNAFDVVEPISRQLT